MNVSGLLYLWLSARLSLEVSPDINLCGWLGPKCQLTNSLEGIASVYTFWGRERVNQQHLCCFIPTGDKERIREILDQDPSQKDACSPQDGATPLMFAAMTGRLDVAELLVQRGCDINKQDIISGWTALMQATYHG